MTTPLFEEPTTLRAFIRESECIGCVKCINVCPVDAIVGRLQKLHTVIHAECTGCTLCIDACPVDCIELVPATQPFDHAKATERAKAKQQRAEQSRHHEQDLYTHITLANTEDPKTARQQAIEAALMREQHRKNKNE